MKSGVGESERVRNGKVAAAVAGAAGGLMLLASRASRERYGRSLSATICEWIVRSWGRKRRYLSAESAIRDLMDHVGPDEAPYELPGWVGLGCGTRDVAFPLADGDELPCITLAPPRGRPYERTLLYLHGGAFDENPLPWHWFMLDAICRRSGVRAVVPLYPLAPNHTYREAHGQLEELYRTLALQLGPDRLVLAGDSAGGNLAAGLAGELCARGEADLLPRRLILLSPWLDLALENPAIGPIEPDDPLLARPGLREIAKVWADGDDLRSPHLSPLYADVSRLRDVTIFIGTREIFLPDALAFAAKLREAGALAGLVVGEGMNHAYPLFPTPEGRIARREIAEIVRG